MFFQNKFKLKYNKEQENVRISIRSSEERIDEFFIEKNDVIQFCNKFNLNSDWFGNKVFQGKTQDNNAFIRINVHENARYTYAMNISDIQVLNSQLFAVLDDIESEDELSSQSQFDEQVIKNILSELNYLRQKITELENREPVEKVIEKQVEIVQPVPIEENDDMPIFIPSKIKSTKLKGSINTKKNNTNFNTNKSLEKLKNNKKGEK